MNYSVSTTMLTKERSQYFHTSKPYCRSHTENRNKLKNGEESLNGPNSSLLHWLLKLN